MSLLRSRSFSPFVGIVFFACMACIPASLEMLGVAGKGIAQLDALNKIGIYAALALSLNIILGQTGLFSMGHTAFFGIGAYVTAILNTGYGWSIFQTMPVAGLITLGIALIVALPIIHLRGDYPLFVTIGIVEIVRIALMNNVFGLTGGANGIYGISRPMFMGFAFSSPQRQFYLIWGFVALTVVLFALLQNSRFGRALHYIKEDDIAAEGCGVNVTYYKLSAFCIGAFWGDLWAHCMPQTFVPLSQLRLTFLSLLLFLPLLFLVVPAVLLVLLSGRFCLLGYKMFLGTFKVPVCFFLVVPWWQ